MSANWRAQPFISLRALAGSKTRNILKAFADAVFNARAGWRWRQLSRAFVAIENVFNQRYDMGKTLVTALGPAAASARGFAISSLKEFFPPGPQSYIFSYAQTRG